MIALNKDNHKSHVIAAGLMEAQVGNDNDGVKAMLEMVFTADDQGEGVFCLVLALLEAATIWGQEAATERDMTISEFLMDWVQFQANGKHE